jgi:peptidoglycan/LPS O-acetylase OafA/YrhL
MVVATAVLGDHKAPADDEPKANSAPKFALIQAGRGLAALWVVLFHIEKGALLTGLTAAMPAWLSYALFDYGSAGVAMFFVISGFVIAHSLANTAMTGQLFLRFIVKRSVRLDPAYWASIAITIAVGVALARFHHNPVQLPSFATIGAHILYLQEILGVPEISIVYWTLTYEIQFYLVFAAATWAAAVLARRWGDMASIIVIAFLCILAFVSAVAPGGFFAKGLFANYWHAFFVGVLAYQAGHQRRNPALLITLVTTMLIASLWKPQVFNGPCALTAIILFLSARGSFLENGLRHPVFQLLGRLSYSLYLIHGSVIVALGGAWGRLAGRGLLADFGALVFLVGLSVIAAACMWWAVERPTHRLASNLFKSETRSKERSN